MTTSKRATIKLKHHDFTIYVSCDDILSPLKKLSHTYSQRDIEKPAENEIAVLANDLKDEYKATFDDGQALEQPFFFENRLYWFEVELESHVTKHSATISHKHRLIEEAFYLNRKGNTLQAALNFGNDVGRCSFKLDYQTGDVSHSANIIFNIFATKMVVGQDLSLINQAIDNIYPLWRYSLSSKTTQQVSQLSRSTDKFELFWLAQFERLVEELQLGVKQIINAPHNRLQSLTKQQALDKVSKRLKPKQLEKAQQLIKAGIANPRISINYKKLSVDTPENRFIKMVINSASDNLNSLITAINTERKTKVSESFILQLTTWQRSFSKVSKQQLWHEVGNFNGLNNESKVLQQGTGYAKVYKVWQQLKHYLNRADGNSNLALKSVAELYEIWCFVEVMELLKSLGFKEQSRELSRLKQVQFEKQFSKDGMAAAFEYKRDSDGVTIKLAHEPSFSPKGIETRTWLANQRPDIVLQVTLSNGESFYILFDAKYRIDNYQISGKDAVPEDAINQMHRYRDAIIHQQQSDNEKPIKSRPVMGAFALYPGFCDQLESDNPYQEAIAQIGIGAFALLPSDVDQPSHRLWLQNYLKQKLGDDDGKNRSNDYYFVEDAARIPPYGQHAIRHKGLTMIAPLNEINRDSNYIQQAKAGKLQGYHTQLLATNRQNVHRNIIREVRNFIVTVRDNSSSKSQYGRYLYRVANVKLLPRHTLDDSLTGKASSDEHLYWLFEFADNPIRLNNEIELPYEEHFKFKLTKAAYLDNFYHWNDIADSYQLYAQLDETW